jgi:hypothetical protein
MKKIIFTIILIIPFIVKSQSPGDIAFTALNADGGDDFSFVALNEISSGTVIYFTDNEWTGSAFNNLNEGRLSWTATSTVDAGTVVLITDPTSNGRSANVGTISSIGSYNLGGSNDCLWALSEAPATSYVSAPTFYGVICNDMANGDTVSGTGLTLGTNGINFDNDHNGFSYTGSRSGQANFSSYLSLIYDSSNWQIETSNGENILPISTTSFTTAGGGGSTDPEPTNQPTSLSATALHEKITLTWTDAATGSQAPSKYVIIGETDSSIDNPVDGTAISNDSDPTGNRVAINIDQGTQTTSFSNLGNTTWYFEIFPYTNSGSDIDFKTDGSLVTANASCNAIQISEIVYNSPGDDWEWIELYNPTANSINISSYTISDAANNTITISSGTIPSYSYYTVYCGGSGTSQFTPDYDGGADFSGGILNNGGDTVYLKDASSNTVDEVPYDDSSPWPTSPDGGSYTLELASLTNNNYFGSSWQGSIPEYGSPGIQSSEAWNTNLTASDNLTISSPDNLYITSDVQITDITISSGAYLTITKTGTLKLTGNLSNSGTVTLNSDSDEFASIIVQGTSSGNITYKRYVADEGTDEWDLIGSPVVGQSINDFISVNSNLSTSGSNYAIGVFSNDGATDTASAMYTYVTSSTSGNLTDGIGYAMATDEADTPGTTLDFTGTVNTSDVTVAIDDQTATLTNYGKWNLIANPYPSFINANSAASGTNFMTTNLDNLHTTYAYIYGYDGDGTWTLYNNTNSATYIAPGQAFFVASDDLGGNSVTFSEAMQTVTGSDDFILGDALEDNFELILKLYEGDTEIDYTRFYFEDGLGLGLDPGYDAGHFSQEASLMSRLLEEDEGVGFVINAMGLENVNDAVIPIVINREAGDNFRISIDTFGIYAGTNVYLEDNQNGTMTLLNQEDFELTPESTLSGTGRFYIHLTANTFSVENEIETSLLNVFKLDRNNFITIEGLATESNQTNLRLYNILGKQVLSTTLTNETNTQRVSTKGLATGVYIIKIESQNNLLTKKIIIK